MFCLSYQICKHDLKALDFEGILNYFRESVPKRFQSEDSVNELFRIASTFKVIQQLGVLCRLQIVELHKKTITFFVETTQSQVFESQYA